MAQGRTRRQHYLPCFVQNGFAYECAVTQGRRRYRIHVFQRGHASEPAYTRRVGFADDFYCRPDEPNVEDVLADEEAKRFVPLVRALRRGVVPANGACDIPAFVVHMILRTQSARRQLVLAGREACDVLIQEIPGRASWARVFEQMPPEARAAYSVMDTAEREHRLGAILKLGTMGFEAIMRAQKERIAEQVRRTQAAALSGNFDALPRTAHLASLRWSTITSSRGAFILGDIGAIARNEGTTRLAAPLMMERPDVVYVPIAHDCVLAGARDGIDPAINPDELNDASADLSLEFFIGFQATERERVYANRIGDRATRQWRQEFIDELRRS